MWDGRGIPPNTLVGNLPVHQPSQSARTPVDGVAMEVGRGVEAEIDATGGAAIPKAHVRAIVAGIEVDVDDHSPGVGSRELDVDLLSRCGSVQEESGNQPRAWRCPNLGFEAPMPKGPDGRKGACGSPQFGRGR